MQLKKYIGEKWLYKKTFRIAVPLSIQSFLASAMGIVDTMMVSAIGMVAAVGTAEQISFLSNMVVYGAVSGTGIFASQFFGSKDYKNLKKTFGFSLIISLINALFWFGLAHFFSKEVLQFYMNDDSVVLYAMQYLNIAKYAMVLASLNFSFSFIFRIVHKAKIALSINSVGMMINVFLNALLIFGYGAIPPMGVQGAAIATVLAQLVKLIIYIAYSKKTNQVFFGTWKEMFALNKSFMTPMIYKMLPLLVNEAMYGFGMSMFVKFFGQLGKESMEAYYVGNQIYNIFIFLVYGYGGAIAVLLGARLGAGKVEEAKEESNYYLGLSVVMAFAIVGSMLIFAKPLVYAFNIENSQVIMLATQIVMVLAIKAAFRLFNFVSFSILRSGGDTKVIQFLDSGLIWLVGLPVTYVCINILGIQNIVVVLLIIQIEQLIRCVGGVGRVLSGKWAKNITFLVES